MVHIHIYPYSVTPNLYKYHKPHPHLSLLTLALRLGSVRLRLNPRLPPIHKIHIHIHMQQAILQLVPHAHTQHLDLLPCPAQDARERGQGVRPNGLELLHLLDAAEFFEFGVFGSGADG